MENNTKKQPQSSMLRILMAAALPLVLLLFWEYAAQSGLVNRNLMPPPTKLIEVFIKYIKNGKLWDALSISFVRVFIGFLISAAAGSVFGFLMGLFKSVNTIISSVVNVLRSIPVIAIAPIFIILLGIGEAANISVIIIGAVWSILLNTTAGVLSTDPKLLELAYVYRVPRSAVILKIMLPSALTQLITGLRLGIGGAWMSVVAAEMMGASSGIGYLITFSKTTTQYDVMYVAVLVIGIIGLVIDRFLLVFQNAVRRKFLGV